MLGDNDTSLPLWEFYSNALDRLGKDGMSSEESEADEFLEARAYLVKPVPWRRNIDQELKTIDKTSQALKNIKRRRGRIPERRLRDRGMHDSERQAPKGLWISDYEEQWYNSLSQGERAALLAKAGKRWPDVEVVND